MLPRMSRPALLALALGAVSAGSGCDVGGALAALGKPTFREVDARQARDWVREGDALLVQARGTGQPAHRLRGARMMAPGEALAEDAKGRRIVIVAEEADLGLSLGARLARAGVTGVAVVSGGLPAWDDDKSKEE
jgi:hypothetical protein